MDIWRTPTLSLSLLFAMQVVAPIEQPVIRAAQTTRNARVGFKAKPVTTAPEAIARAEEITGFGKFSPDSIDAVPTVVSGSLIPFLADSINGRVAWTVRMPAFTLKFRSHIGERSTPPHQRDFDVVIDQTSGQLLSISSTSTGQTCNCAPEPSAHWATNDIRNTGETYEGLGKSVPKLRFVDALKAIEDHGLVEPASATEIDGVYVIESTRGWKHRPVWAITMRGIPALPASRGGIPLFVLNRARVIVDAENGAILDTGNVPRPEPQVESNRG